MMERKPERKKTDKKKASKRLTASEATTLLARTLPRLYSEEAGVRVKAAQTLQSLAFAHARKGGFEAKLKVMKEFLKDIPAEGRAEKIAVALYRITRNKNTQARLPESLSGVSESELEFMRYIKADVKSKSLRELVVVIV